MYNYIVSILSNNTSYKYPFNKEFRRGYVKSWVSDIKSYKP